MLQVLEIIPLGKFVSKHVDATSFKVDFTVDPAPLLLLITRYDELYEFSTEGKGNVSASSRKKKVTCESGVTD